MRHLFLITCAFFLLFGCGEDPGGDPIETMIPGCPPDGPFGTMPGETAPDITLYECDGTPIQLNALCGRRVSLVYNFAAWCPPCREHLRNEMVNEHMGFMAAAGDDDFETWVVVEATEDRSPVTPGDCYRTWDEYGLVDVPNLKVVYDPDGVTQSQLGMQENLANFVMTRRRNIVLNGPWGSSTVDREVRSALDRTPPLMTTEE